MRRSILASVIVAAAVGLTAACSSSGSSSPAAAAGQSSPAGQASSAAQGGCPVQSEDILSAGGTTPTIFNFATYVLSSASGSGIGAKNGVDVSIKTATSTQSSAALTSGSQHFAGSAFAATANAIAAGLPLKIVAAWGLHGPREIIADKSITSISQLAGKPFCITSIGNDSQTGPVEYWKANGLDPNSLHWVVSGTSNNSLSYTGIGRCVATAATADSAEQYAATHKNLHILVDAQQWVKSVPDLGGALITSDAFIKSDPTTVQKMVTAVIEATRVSYSSQSDFTSLADKAFPAGFYTPTLLNTLYGIFRPNMAVNGGMTQSILQASYDSWKEYDANPSAQKTPVTGYQQIVDPEFVQAALKQIGKVSGTDDLADYTGA